MPKLLLCAVIFLFAACVAAVGGQGRQSRADNKRRQPPPDFAPVVFLDSTKEIDGLKGPVRRVETEVLRVGRRRGKLVPKSRELLERTLYDERGRRVENETYPVAGGRPSGEETHRYDAQGNVSETIARDARGQVLSKTVYEYELDGFGNWIRMTASVVVSQEGKTGFETTEITNRTITYYFVDEAKDQNVAAGAPPRPPVIATAEGARVSKRVEASDAEKQSEVLPGSPAGGGERLDVGVLNSRTTELPKPAYPVGHRRLDVPVTVTVEVIVDITGHVAAAKARNGPSALREPAESAARRAVFLPFYVAGRPVEAKGLLNYTFDYLP